MDGSYTQAAVRVAQLLTAVERQGDGLTPQAFEAMVRTVWRSAPRQLDTDDLQLLLEAHFAALGGFVWKVTRSSWLAGGLDVSGRFQYAGICTTHTVHLW